MKTNLLAWTLAAALLLGAAPIQAQGLPPVGGTTTDLNKMGAAMAMPFVTRNAGPTMGPGYTATTILISNTKFSGPVALHFEVISGDDGTVATDTTIPDFWGAFDFTCVTTASETTQITITPVPEGSVFTYECSDFNADRSGPPEARNRKRAQATHAHSGILWVTQVDLFTGQTLNGDILEGRSVVTDFGRGVAYLLEAVTFQGLAGQDGNNEWRFDGNEFPNAARVLTTSFLAPDAGDGLEAHLLLFTLDGTLGTAFGQSGAVPNPTLLVNYYNDDEIRRSTGIAFKCFAFVNVASITTQGSLGSQAGHMDLKSAAVQPLDTAHETAFGNGDALRVFPVYGYLLQILRVGGRIQNDRGVSISAAPAAGPMAWASPLTMSNEGLVPAPGDRPTLAK